MESANLHKMQEVVESLKQTTGGQTQKAFNYNTQALSGHLPTQAKSTCDGGKKATITRPAEEGGMEVTKKVRHWQIWITVSLPQ